MQVEQVMIIGAGPAGLATAFQLKRYGIHPLIFERANMGGSYSTPIWLKNTRAFHQVSRDPS